MLKNCLVSLYLGEQHTFTLASNRYILIGKTMIEILAAIATGMIVGIIFSFFKLPLPAPPVLSGIMGIVGIYLGGVTYQWIADKFFT